jgi:Domain of unknown function (DUF4136)
MKNTRTAVLLAALLLVASVAWAEIKTDYDHKANFAGYKTYSWGKVQTSDSLWDQRVKDDVNSQLAAKGLSEVPSGGDVVVNAMGTTRNQPTLNTFYDGFGGWRWGGFGESTTTVENYQVGTLVVDMFDGNTKGLIWRGVASGTLSDKTEKNIKNLDKDVQKMFQHFPPSGK